MLSVFSDFRPPAVKFVWKHSFLRVFEASVFEKQLFLHALEAPNAIGRDEHRLGPKAHDANIEYYLYLFISIYIYIYIYI